MGSLKTIKKRISSVKSTQKITRAMKLIAAAKLRRAQARALNARHYTAAIGLLASRIAGGKADAQHSLTLSRPQVAGRDYLILSSDRGLCGGFNNNLLRRLGDELAVCREQKIKVACRTVGKKGRDYFRVKHWELEEGVIGLYNRFDRSMAEELARVAIHRFESGAADEVCICYNFFQSAMVQRVTFEKILPLEANSKLTPIGDGSPYYAAQNIDYIYEPSAGVVLDQLLRESVVAKIYSAFLESMASELAARMTAMESATSNASDRIDYLTLQYNRARQAAITRELMDIVNGAEALR